MAISDRMRSSGISQLERLSWTTMCETSRLPVGASGFKSSERNVWRYADRLPVPGESASKVLWGRRTRRGRRLELKSGWLD